MNAIFAGYLTGMLAMTLQISIEGRFWKLDSFLFFSIYVGGTVLGVWLVFFLPVYLLSNKADFIWRFPWNIAIGALSGALLMGAIWWDMVKQSLWVLSIPILIMAVAFLCGSYFKRKYEYADSTLHPILGRVFLALSLLLLLVANGLHAAADRQTTILTFPIYGQMVIGFLGCCFGYAAVERHVVSTYQSNSVNGKLIVVFIAAAAVGAVALLWIFSE